MTDTTASAGHRSLAIAEPRTCPSPDAACEEPAAQLHPWSQPPGTSQDIAAEHLPSQPTHKAHGREAIHLGYIDGLRGLCALYIVLHHLAAATGYVHGWFVPVIEWGGYCVAVFITISGFCLMLPVTRAGNTLRGGARRFYRRRIRRILPPYYAALLLSVLLLPLLSVGQVTFAGLLAPPQAHSLLMHAVLLHNWSNATKYTFNGPLWSVAVECQIYVTFPLLVALWRRLPAPLAVTCVGAVSVAASVLLGYHGNVHYLLLFALGMWAAECAGNPVRLRHSAMLVLPCVAAVVLGTVRWPLLGDVGVGALTALLLARGATQSHGVLPRALAWRPLRSLGLFSYSIYLVHEVPLLLLGVYAKPLLPWTPGWDYLLLTTTAVPLVLLLAYLFYLAFERPFLSHAAKVADAQEQPGFARTAPSKVAADPVAEEPVAGEHVVPEHELAPQVP